MGREAFLEGGRRWETYQEGHEGSGVPPRRSGRSRVPPGELGGLGGPLIGPGGVSRSSQRAGKAPESLLEGRAVSGGLPGGLGEVWRPIRMAWESGSPLNRVGGVGSSTLGPGGVARASWRAGRGQRPSGELEGAARARKVGSFSRRDERSLEALEVGWNRRGCPSGDPGWVGWDRRG